MLRLKGAGVYVVLAVTLLTSRGIAAPKIQFDRTVYDFGTTSQVESVTGVFRFQNTGDAELKVSRPMPTCGCTVASIQPDTLKPGEKGELKFTLRFSAPGPIEKHITVPSNDPSQAQVSLGIKALVKTSCEVSPSQVVLGPVRQGSTTNFTATVRRVDGKKLVIQKLENQGRRLQAKTISTENGDPFSAQIAVEVSVGTNFGGWAESVAIYTDDGPAAAIRIGVTGRTVGDVAVTPVQVTWGVGDLDQLPPDKRAAALMRKILVNNTSAGQPLQLSNPSSNLKDLSFEIVTVETGKIYQVVAKLTELPKQSESGTITFNTNLASTPQVTVPVMISIYGR